jgi:hypothetical protein
VTEITMIIMKFFSVVEELRELEVRASVST